ncbi:MAG: DUF2723 domain-containing protein [Myxococcales bacterium]|nr:DUF2723 domain-containing protein [Myxococcales bacterium]
MVFLWRAAPGLTWYDAGELATAASTLGIAHPTGFPGWILLGKLSTLLPFGPSAFRVVIMSCAAGAITVGVGAAVSGQLAARLGLQVLPTMVVAALLLLAQPTLALHSTTVEVYSPTVALLCVLWRVAPSARAAVVGGLVGVLAGLHGASAALPAFAAWCGHLLTFHSSAPWRRRALVSVAFALLGALVLAYLPVRAAADPYSGWGDPSSLGGLWDHLSGARIRGAYAQDMGATGKTWVLAQWVFSQLWDQVGVALPMAVIGLVALRVAAPSAALPLGGAVVADVAYTLFVNPMGMRDAQTGVIAAVAAALLAAVGLVMVVERAMRSLEHTGRPWIDGSLAVVVALAITHHLPPWPEAHALRGPTLLVDGALAQIPPAGVLFVGSDDFAATTLYAQGVEQARPDVVRLVKQHLHDPHAWRRAVRDDGLGRLPDALIPPADLLGYLARLHVSTQWELGEPALDAVLRSASADWRVVFRLPFVEVVPVGVPTREPDLIAEAERSRAALIRLGDVGPESRAVVARALSLAGTAVFSTRPGAADRWILAAHALAPDDVKVATNASARLLELGRLDEAIAASERVAATRPDAVLPRYNAGVAAVMATRLEEGRRWFLDAAPLGLSRLRAARALHLLAVGEANRGNAARAVALGWFARDGLDEGGARAVTAMIAVLGERLVGAQK